MPINGLVFILFAAVVGLFIYRNLFPSLPDGYAAMSATEAAKKLGDAPETQLLDVRTPREFGEGHLRHAVNLNLFEKAFKTELGKLDRDAPYLVYCRSGHRSAKALAIMKRLGFTRVGHLAHGLEDWKREGLPLVG